ncbi:hypothetical protein bpr_II053 (plasmid) [Butyrivibrio proteoclasticus B316]|uniref:Uncharacterized protein n=1 Tax=Butyrivibrio proteoclasticus (strain ATCC 51982 / DSM 14932 / B316) TaxID=515622 RepID=E0S3L1_BUTPB|nr:hypothetical protein [Butyrivibrio proteoclasticus]ADL35993.1 hypothetical protein bpr_II053 [Butyrivibrio proteoclasticus B316]
MKKKDISKSMFAIMLAAALALGSVGGAAGSMAYHNLSEKSAETAMAKDRVQDTQEEIQTITRQYIEDYLAQDTVSQSGIIVADSAPKEIAERAAEIVTANLINGSYEGIVSDAEIKELETKLTKMVKSYNLTDEQTKTLSKSVAAIIEADLDSKNTKADGTTALSQAAQNNIKALEDRITAVEKDVAELKNTVATIKSEGASLQKDTTSATTDYASSSTVSDLQTKYNDLLERYNKQSETINNLIKENGEAASADAEVIAALRSEIASMTASLDTLKGSIQGQIAALEAQLEDASGESADNSTELNQLKAAVIEKEGEISQLQSKVSSLQQQITLAKQANTASEAQLQEEINELKTSDATKASQEDVDALEDELTQTKEKLTQAEAELVAANTVIGELQTDITTKADTSVVTVIQQSVSDLQTTVGDIDSKKADLETLDSMLENMITALGGTTATTTEDNIASMTAALSALKETVTDLSSRVGVLENKVKNVGDNVTIGSGANVGANVNVPFSFGMVNGKYGYYDSTNTFVDFKSQADIDSAVSAAKIGTATAEDVLAGKTFTNASGSGITGTMKSTGAATYTPGTADQTIAAGSYLSGAQTIKGDQNLTGANIASGKSIFNVNGTYTSDATAAASQMLKGYTAYVKGQRVTGSIESLGAQTITPKTTDQTIVAGKYLSGNQVIKGDANLVAGNIKAGTTIFNTKGTFTSDATASAAQILTGYTAYVNGSKITGTMKKNPAKVYGAYKSTSKVDAVTSGTTTLSDIVLGAGSQITLPAGFYDTDTVVKNGVSSSGTTKLVSGKSTKSAFTVDCKSLPNYTSLTKDNFLVVIEGIEVSSIDLGFAYRFDSKASMSWSYNASTGQLTVNQAFLSYGVVNQYSNNLWAYVSVYYIS